jgi:hypothetical protein
MLALSTNGAVELTAYATLVLAVATGVLALGTFMALRLTRASLNLTERSLAQTREDIALSRREVEEAHRPVLVPLQKSGEGVRFRGGQIPASGGPYSTENAPDRPDDLPGYSSALLPVENVGMGPALNVRGEFTGPRGAGGTPYPTEAIAVGAQGVVSFENAGEDLSYTGDDLEVSAVIQYDDVAGRTHQTSIVFDVKHNAYRSTLSGEPSG